MSVSNDNRDRMVRKRPPAAGGGGFTCLSIIAFLVACGDPENPHFTLTLERGLGMTDESVSQSQLRCDAETDFGCGKLNLTSRAGAVVDLDDAFVVCSDGRGDLVVRVASSSSDQSDTSVELRVHRNLAPEGFAYCQGIEADEESGTQFSKNSCDVQVYHGSGVFAANPFQSCLVVMESGAPVQGRISCPFLNAGPATVFVNEAAFLCEIGNNGR
jgi:hypothetical protein